MVGAKVKISNVREKHEIELMFPETWDELTPKQLLYIGKYWQAWQSLSKINESLMKARGLLMLELCGLKTKKEKRRLCDYLTFVDKNTGVNILDRTNFVFEKLDLTKQILPKVKVALFTHYYGPEDRLKDISIDEFSYAFGIYNAFTKSNNDTYLDSLMAILYRPAADKKDYNKTGEFKVAFTNKLVSKYELKIKKLPFEYKQAVFLFFSGCLEYLAQKFKDVFERAQPGMKSGGNFIDSVVHMSGGKFGNYDETKRQNCIQFLKEMNDTIVEQKNRKTA